MAVETSIDPQLALSDAELSQVAVDGEGPRPVQPDHCQVTVHQERGHVLWSWRKWSEGMGVTVAQNWRLGVQILVVPSLSVVTVVQLEAALPMLLKQAALS